MQQSHQQSYQAQVQKAEILIQENENHNPKHSDLCDKQNQNQNQSINQNCKFLFDQRDFSSHLNLNQNHKLLLNQQKIKKISSNGTSQQFYNPLDNKQSKDLKFKSNQKTFTSKISSFERVERKDIYLPQMKNHVQKITGITVLVLLHKVVQRMRQRGDDMTLQCLINEEKLIRISITFIEKQIVKKEEVEKNFSLEKEIITFVQKINKVTMENFKEQDQNVDIKIFSKAVDLLMIPGMNKFVSDIKKLARIKVLTFNNLACIFKKKKKFGIALRSVSFALQIEQALLSEQANQQKYDIIPTYLNKAAILSEMKKHDKAIQEIMKSQKFIQKIEKQVVKQIADAESNSNLELKKRLQQKRYYGLYMKMIINYNMGAEKQHMKMTDAACEFYQQGKQLAHIISNDFMAKRFEAILIKISDRKKK